MSVYLYGCIVHSYNRASFSRCKFENAHMGLVCGVFMRAIGSMHMSREHMSTVQVISKIEPILQSFNFLKICRQFQEPTWLSILPCLMNQSSKSESTLKNPPY